MGHGLIAKQQRSPCLQPVPFWLLYISCKQLVKLEITADLVKARILSSLATLSGSRELYLENH